MVILPTWLTGAQAIKHLQVSRSTFYRLVREGRITPYYLPGVADPRYNQEELDALFTPAPRQGGGSTSGTGDDRA
ncbi:helix-turn-helix domain-containing protein [Symbiobacterium thermophilum]|uniref:helix-turn-helix domain-containing protein n=1 Tax=Symbiobacterium thermophilum TaxID=2734 RepID=UPI000321F34E